MEKKQIIDDLSKMANGELLEFVEFCQELELAALKNTRGKTDGAFEAARVLLEGIQDLKLEAVKKYLA